MRGQPKVWSFIESIGNILIGYWVALISQLIIFPLVGIHIPFFDNLVIGFWMTLVSIVRSYFLRRFFNWLHVQGFYERFGIWAPLALSSMRANLARTSSTLLGYLE